MNWDDKQERARFLTAFRALAELHQRDVSSELARLYHSVLAGHDIETVLSAMHQAAVKLRFFPKPVELIEFIVGSKEDIAMAAEEQARLVLSAAATHGAYATVQFVDGVTNAVVSRFFGGWASVCATKENTHKWFVKDFCERYAEYKAHGVESIEPLRGIAAAGHVRFIGGEPPKVIESAGRDAVRSVVSSIAMAQRRAFEDGAPFHEIVLIGREKGAGHDRA